MPKVIGIIAGVLLTIVGFVVPGAQFLIPLGASLVLGAISKMLAKGPGSSALSHQLSSRTVTSRQAVAPWQIMYGKNRAGGIITMLHTTGANNEFLHIVITLAGHEVNAIPLMYFDGVNVPLDGSGNATGNFSGFAHAEFNLGTKDQAAFAGLVAAAGSFWTSAYRQRGRAGAYVRLKWDQTKFPNGVPNITFDIQGRKVYDPRTGTLAYSRNAALCIADYLSNASFGLTAQTKYPITAAMLANSGFSGFTAANVVDGDVTTNGWSNNTTNANSTITADLGAGNPQEFHRCRMYLSTAGQAQTYHVQWSDDNITYHTVEEGFAAGMLPDVAGWNETELAPAGAHRYWRILGIATITEAGFVNELEFYTSDVDSVQLTAAANTCDEQVNLAAGGTENRFMIDGSFAADVLPAEVITRMNSAMMGSAVYVAGVWGVYPGIYRSPTISLTDSDLRAGLSVQTRASHRDLFNGVKGIFISPTNSWQLSDFPPYQDPVYVKEDNNEAIWKDVELPFTISAAAAQRLAKIELRRMRRQIIVTAQFKISAYQVQVMDVVQFSHPRFGWANKTFEVASCQLIYAPDAGGGSALAAGVDVTLHETDSTVYDWSSAEENQIAAPPVPNLPQVALVQPPTGFAINPVEVVRTVDNIRQSFIEATWTAPADWFVISGGHIIVQYKKHADSLWIHAGTLDGGVVKAEIGPLIDGVSYDVQIWAENTSGAKSSATTATGTSTGVNFFTTSTVLNPQGSIIPAPSTASPFTTETGGPGTGQMYIRTSWIAQTVYRPDGTTISAPSSASTYSIAAAPTLSQVAGGVRVLSAILASVALVKGGKIVSISPSSSLSVSANNLLKITSPSSVAGYDGWIPLVWQLSPMQLQNAEATIAFGTDWTEPTTHFVFTATGINDTSRNTAGITFIDLATATQHFFYPYWDGANVVFSGGANVGSNLPNAAAMFLDGHSPFAGTAGFTTSTPGGGGSGSGGGGGCVMIGSRIFPLAGPAIGIELPNEEWILLEAGDHVLICTPDHPVISEERGKTRADQLRLGEVLICDDGGQHLRRAISLLFKGTKEKVEMPDGHLFWANGILSHNHKPL